MERNHRALRPVSQHYTQLITKNLHQLGILITAQEYDVDFQEYKVIKAHSTQSGSPLRMQQQLNKRGYYHFLLKHARSAGQFQPSENLADLSGRITLTVAQNHPRCSFVPCDVSFKITSTFLLLYSIAPTFFPHHLLLPFDVTTTSAPYYSQVHTGSQPANSST